MISNAELSELLAELYAAPLEPHRWQSFLDRLCALINTQTGYLVGSYAEEGNIILAGGGLNFDPGILQLYNEHYGDSDPYRSALIKKGEVGFIHGEELIPHRDLVRTSFYNDLLVRYGLDHMNILCCSHSATDIEVLSLWNTANQAKPATASIKLLESLIPHIQTAMQLRRRLTGAATAQVFSEVALDALSIAALLVDRTGKILHLNRLAFGYLSEPRSLCVQQGRLTATIPSETALLHQFIARAAPAHPRVTEGPAGGALKLGPLNLTVVPAPQNHNIPGNDSYAIVFVSDPAAPLRSRAEIMRQLYHLTPAETRLTDRLLQGLDLREAAEQVDISIETARFRLKHIFGKTGTRRQAELLRLMLLLPVPGPTAT
jgi:DNA-binding CsgD family transcriptional regulator